MNLLVVGTDKSDISQYLPARYLLVDDGSLIDTLRIPRGMRVERLDFSKHSFNPLKDISYKRALDFIDVLEAAFPKGTNTLTKQNASFVLLEALLANPKRLDKLVLPSPTEKDTGVLDAHRTIQTVLMSPVLNPFLTKRTNFHLDGIVLVRLDNTLARRDRFIIANLLIANYAGQIVVTDFGQYACDFHADLIREGRLIVGVNFLDEAPGMRNNLLLIEKKIARHATVGDAEYLANYSGFVRGQKGHTDFIEEAIA
jgi:hypothetical protein